MPEPKPALTEEEIRSALVGLVKGVDANDLQFARRIEAAVLAKRDAQWREAAKGQCNFASHDVTCAAIDPEPVEGSIYDKTDPCPACRTVRRMEER